VGTFKAILPVKTNTELSHEEFNEKLVANPGALKELCDTGKYCATATNFLMKVLSKSLFCT
jgi:hypothetical protein